MTSTFGATGISMDRYADILDRMGALAIEWKGASLSTDEEELFGHILRQLSLESDTSNEKIQAIYDAMSISNNSGVPLDNILELINMSRQSAARSTATETFTASKATTVPAGTVVRTSSKVYWTTDEDLVFTAAGSASVGITCTVDGANNAAADEINVLVTSISGITAVTNADAAIPGRLRETDAELKLRHSTAVATSGDRDAASIAEAVGSVDGVSAVLPIEDYDADTVTIYVIGGDDDEIAAAMDPQITIGVGPILQGTTSVDIYNSNIKQARTMKFTRGADVDIYIALTIQVTSLFPADGDAQIKSAISDLFEELTLGDDVVYLKLPGAIYQVAGVIVQSLYIGTAASPTGTADIEMDNSQRPVIDEGNISITHV